MTCHPKIEDALRYTTPAIYLSEPSAFGFLFFFPSRKLFVRRVFSSSSTRSLSDFTSSGLYQEGGWVTRVGPLGNKAIVKWKPATNVLEGVKLFQKRR